MCGIAGIFNVNKHSYENIDAHLRVMNTLQKHRGPDGNGTWSHCNSHVGFAHCRLSIIDLDVGAQPMTTQSGNWITYNGEIYNYIELRNELKNSFAFKTNSDTEVILAAYEKWGPSCLNHLRGMFAFAIWDEKKNKLFCARDRFGIKPLYYLIRNNTFYFASEIKTLLPFIDSIDTDLGALREYLTFQFTIGENTLFKGIKQLLPGYSLIADRNGLEIEKYWEVYYEINWDKDEEYFINKVDSLMRESVKLHMRSDVPVGAYVSGGLDSSIVASLASQSSNNDTFFSFTGKFTYGKDYDESRYARMLAEKNSMRLFEIDIKVNDFIENIEKIIYHLDTPVAGPGSFPQFMVSRLAAESRKVVLGGQGGDEIFGGYVRYLLAYFEQCIKGAIDGTLNNGNFIVTYESIIPNLQTLREYKPLMTTFWKKGLFEPLDKRYFHLIDRSSTLTNEIEWNIFKNIATPYEDFKNIFLPDNVGHHAYFDLMTHFDFKTLLPALLHVEDRMSMAHGLESRVPFLDHPLIELVATIPPHFKFKGGKLKRMLHKAFGNILPDGIVQRKDKMGFPVPLNEWMNNELKDFLFDTFSSESAKDREFMKPEIILKNLSEESKFGRKIWGLLSLELWMKQFHDKHYEYLNLLK